MAHDKYRNIELFICLFLDASTNDHLQEAKAWIKKYEDDKIDNLGFYKEMKHVSDELGKGRNHFIFLNNADCSLKPF